MQCLDSNIGKQGLNHSGYGTPVRWLLHLSESRVERGKKNRKLFHAAGNSFAAGPCGDRGGTSTVALGLASGACGTLGLASCCLRRPGQLTLASDLRPAGNKGDSGAERVTCKAPHVSSSAGVHTTHLHKQVLSVGRFLCDISCMACASSLA